ncbi:unnamed protein product [Linum trigynum]|uniref:Uncharacterized protein n=1 Tax=Linum trigynum TaxID=586398 RepID=A0AAV2CE94_9ROSI
MDFQPLPPPGLTLEEKVVRACENYRLSLLEENKEVEGALNDNHMKLEELTPETSHGEDEQEDCIDHSHHLPLPESNFEDQDTSVEEQENRSYELAWHLALQTVLEDMNGKEEEVIEEEEESIEEGEDFECSQGEEIEEEGREVEKEVEGASEVQDEDEVVVDEASTSYKCKHSFPPDLDVLLEKDPFAALCQAKAKPSTIPLGGCDGGKSMMHYMVWGKEKKEEGKKKMSHGWSLKATQVHEPSIIDSSNARDLRHHLTDENLNFKEVLDWTKLEEQPSGSGR